MAIVNSEIRFAPQLTTWFTANPTKVLQNGEIVYCSDGANIGKYVIGDNSTQLSALTFYGGISESGLTVGTTTITGGTSTRVLYNNAGVVGEYAVTGSGSVVLSSELGNYLTTANAALTYQPLDSDLTSWSSVTRAAGFDTFVTTPSSANLASLVSDETGSGALVFGTSPIFTTGITVNGSQVTNIGTGKMSILAFSGSQVAMYMNNTTAAGATNYAVLTTNSTAMFNGRTNMSLAVGGTSYFNLNPAANNVMWSFSNANKTGNTASTELPFFKVVGAQMTWDNGGGATTIPTQRWNWFTSNTGATSGGGSLTITDSFNGYFENVTASGITITNNYSLGTEGKAKFGGNIELTQTVTTEALVSDTSVTIVINGVTYKLLAKA